MSCSIERYPFAFRTSQKILNACKCSFYPIDIKQIIITRKAVQIIAISETNYQRFRAETHQTRPYISIKDGRTYYDPDRDLYIIVYNDSRPQNRIRFTLAHEFAHIVLGHLSDEHTEIDRGGLPDTLYFSYEGAANTFAGNFLAPPIILAEKLGKKTFASKSVASIFNISEQAAREYRKDDFIYWKSTSPRPEELSVLSRYRRRLITFFCDHCGAVFSIKGAKYCPICGNHATPLRAGDDGTMGRTYPGIELDESGKAKECPTCKNEEHLAEAKFCMICGGLVVNQCTFAIIEDVSYEQCSHDEPLPGNARYCPYCGSKTTFFEKGILAPWDDPKIQDTSASLENTDDDGPLPF